MRKITEEAVEAFNNGIEYNNSNTKVEVLPNVTILKLYDNAIAYRYNDPKRTLSITDCGYPTKITKERLNAIDGVNIEQKKGVWYLNGKEWDGGLIDIAKT